ncbi:MAG: class I SAM-dependent methyltransferase, partial [Myxococcales bacterium]|nr:class I SAM-dependent methyltransferase [Myxococcales bacterium]
EAAGFKRSQASLFVWEGVSMYLAASAVRQTLGRVAQLGGQVVFDAWCPRPHRLSALERLGERALGWAGEPLRWAPTPMGLEAMCAAAGLQVVEVRSARQVPGFATAHPGLRLCHAQPG